AGYRFVERVYAPLFVLCLVTSAISAGSRNAFGGEAVGMSSRGFRSLWIPGTFLAQCLLVSISVASTWRDLSERRREASQVWSCLERQSSPLNRKTLAYLDPATTIGLENFHP